MDKEMEAPRCPVGRAWIPSNPSVSAETPAPCPRWEALQSLKHRSWSAFYFREIALEPRFEGMREVNPTAGVLWEVRQTRAVVRKDEFPKDWRPFLPDLQTVFSAWAWKGERGMQCPGQGSDCMLGHLLAGCSLKGFNLSAVNALSLALFSRSKWTGSSLHMPSPEMMLYFIPLVLAVRSISFPNRDGQLSF